MVSTKCTISYAYLVVNAAVIISKIFQDGDFYSNASTRKANQLQMPAIRSKVKAQRLNSFKCIFYVYYSKHIIPIQKAIT